MPSNESPSPRQTCLFVVGVLVVTIFVSALLVAALGWWMNTREVPGTRLTYAAGDFEAEFDDSIVESTASGLRGLGYPCQVQRLKDGDVAVDVASVDAKAIRAIKALLSTSHTLEFLILAPDWDSDPVIGRARAGSSPSAERDGFETSELVRDDQGTLLARWISLARGSRDDGSKGSFLSVDPGGLVIRDAADGRGLKPDGPWTNASPVPDVQALTLHFPELVLDASAVDFATATVDENGSPAISLRFTDEGSIRLAALTKIHEPARGGSKLYRLAVVLNDEIITAPTILVSIRREARITGDFTREEVDEMVGVIHRARIPIVFPAEPKSESLVPVRLAPQ